MKRINISFLGNTSHITFAQHVLDSIKAVELFDLDKQEDSVIKLALEQFRSHIADVSQLKRHSRRHDLQEQKDILNRERKDCGYLITHTLKAMLYSKHEREEAQELLNWMGDVAPKFPNGTIGEVSRIITIMRSQMIESPEIVHMIDNLGMLGYFDELFETNDKYMEVQIENIQLFSQKNKPLNEKNDIRNSAYKALRRLIAAIEWSVEWYGDKHREIFHALRRLLVDASKSEKLRKRRVIVRDIESEDVPDLHQQTSTIEGDNIIYSHKDVEYRRLRYTPEIST